MNRVLLWCRCGAAICSAESGKAVQHKAAGDGDVETGAATDHRDLDAGVGLLNPPFGNTVVFVAEQDDGALARRSQTSQRSGFSRQFDGGDATDFQAQTLDLLFRGRSRLPSI